MLRIRRGQAGMAFIFVTILLDTLGVGIIIPIMPQLVASFMHGDAGAAARYFGYFVAVFSAMQFLFAPLMGALSDQYGRRPVLLISLFGAGIDYMLMATAPTLGLLFVGRVISGITSANVTAANAYIADVSAPEERARNFGLVGAAFGVGFIVGPLLGGLFGAYGLRVPFVAAAVLTLTNALYGLFVLPESLAPENRRRFHWRQANPFVSLGFLGRYPVVLRLVTTLIFIYLGQQTLYSTWVLYSTYRFNWDAWQQGISLAFFGAIIALVQAVILPMILPRLGAQRAIIVGLISSVVGYLLYGLATQGWMMYIIMIVASLSFILQPAIQGYISNIVSADEQGKVQGAITSLLSLTAIVGPILSTVLFSYFTAPERTTSIPGASFFFAAFLMLLALILALWTFRQPSAEQPSAAEQELVNQESEGVPIT